MNEIILLVTVSCLIWSAALAAGAVGAFAADRIDRRRRAKKKTDDAGKNP